MPSVMSMIFTNYFYGRKGIKELLKKLTIWKVNLAFYVFALFYTVASIYIPVFICNITGVNYKLHINNQLSGFYRSNPLIILAYFLAVVFFGGPFGEELGWRGFVLPKLQKKFNSLISSIILGVIWACLHLPLFFVHAEGYNISFTTYLIETIWLTIIITWLYNNTHGSLLIIILFHGVDNFIFLLSYSDFMSCFNSYTVVFYTMRLIVLLCIIFDMIRKSSNKLERENNYFLFCMEGKNMNSTFKIAIVQEKRHPYDMSCNTEEGLSIVKKAKELGADIVLFPECWITGYEFPKVDEILTVEEIMKTEQFKEWNALAIDENNQYIQAFCGMAKELNIGVVITGYTKGINRPQNSAFVISKNGEILMKYSKVHTCDFADERMLECGNEFKVCDFEGIKIGIMICYDREYPESARILMLKGAEIILVPNDCESMKPRLQVLSTRAYENMVGVVMANPPGKNAGCSCAFSPITWDENGIPIENTIVLADDETECIFIAEYDLEKLRDYRSHEMMGNTFRKVKAYSELLNDDIKEPFKR